MYNVHVIIKCIIYICNAIIQFNYFFYCIYIYIYIYIYISYKISYVTYLILYLLIYYNIINYCSKEIYHIYAKSCNSILYT